MNELAVHRDRSHSPQNTARGNEHKLFGPAAVDDDKAIVSEDDAPDKEVGNDSLKNENWQ